VGAKITRKRTLVKYLDGVNFASGSNQSADPSAEFADDVYYIDRKSRETRDVVEFELAASFDLEGVALPRRQIVQNVCPWGYRSAECGYTGTAYFNANDVSVSLKSQDACGKRLSSCQRRFGSNAELPFGGFPAAGLIR
jgi:lambda family phage minor tail protein L